MKNHIVASIILIFAISSCAIKPIAFEGIEKPSVDKLKLDGSDISFGIKIKNPNSMGFKIVNSKLSLTVNKIDAGKIGIAKKIKIKANGSTTIPMVLKINNSKLLTIGTMSLFGDPDVSIKGIIKGRKFIFTKKYEVEFKDQVSLQDFMGQ